MEQLSKQWIVRDAQYAEDSAGQRFKIKDFFEVITGEAWSLAAEAYRKLSSTVMQLSIHKAVQLLYVWYINIYNSESAMH